MLFGTSSGFYYDFLVYILIAIIFIASIVSFKKHQFYIKSILLNLDSFILSFGAVLLCDYNIGFGLISETMFSIIFMIINSINFIILKLSYDKDIKTQVIYDDEILAYKITLVISISILGYIWNLFGLLSPLFIVSIIIGLLFITFKNMNIKKIAS